MNKTMKLLLGSIVVFIFQFIYYRLTIIILNAIGAVWTDLTNDQYLMIHHFFQFILIFIPLLCLQRKTKLDFGIHRITNYKEAVKGCVLAAAYELTVVLIVGMINGFNICLSNADSYLFQFFFSGLGEEPLYRALPLVILPLLYSGSLRLPVGSKHSIPLDVIISAVLFAAAHIWLDLATLQLSFSITQVIVSFGAGIILGLVFKKSNNLWLCMLAHGLMNVIAVTFG